MKQIDYTYIYLALAVLAVYSMVLLTLEFI
jgi:hypothetical protein